MNRTLDAPARWSTAPTAQPGRGAKTIWRLIAIVIASAACIQSAYHLALALGADDTENLEATRVLATARQLEVGPGGLYGPFGGSNPWVLIQAPFYYRVTALTAWPATILGLGAIPACFAAGRLVSLASLVACLAAVGWLARRRDAERGAAWWTVGLVLSSPILATFPVTVRPDMLGVALQLTGLCVAWWVIERRPERLFLPSFLAFLSFGLAVVTKQHYVVGPTAAIVLLGWAWWTGRIAIRPVLAGSLTAAALVLTYLALEQAITSGQLRVACLELPGRLRAVTAGSWGQVALVFRETGLRSAGLLAIRLASVAAAGRRLRWAPLDAFLAAYAAAELALMVRLCHDSSGAWFNYALPAMLALAALAGRQLDRLSRNPVHGWRLAPLLLAAILILAVDARLVIWGVRFHAREAAALEQLLAEPVVARTATRQRYFAGSLQHYNWRAGRTGLTHDVWLFAAFEAIRAAEPRSLWLARALGDGSVGVVILPSASPAGPGIVEGVDRPLPALGYERVTRSGPFDVWELRAAAARAAPPGGL